MNNRTSNDALTIPDGATVILRPACPGSPTYKVTHHGTVGVWEGELWFEGTAHSPSQGPIFHEYRAVDVLEIVEE